MCILFSISAHSNFKIASVGVGGVKCKILCRHMHSAVIFEFSYCISQVKHIKVRKQDVFADIFCLPPINNERKSQLFLDNPAQIDL